MNISIIAYDSHGIYGIGNSANDALKNAKEFDADTSNLLTAKASSALAKHVNDFGGDVSFSVESDGTAYLITDDGNLI
jgi:hypothetical protein